MFHRVTTNIQKEDEQKPEEGVAESQPESQEVSSPQNLDETSTKAGAQDEQGEQEEKEAKNMPAEPQVEDNQIEEASEEAEAPVSTMAGGTYQATPAKTGPGRYPGSYTAPAYSAPKAPAQPAAPAAPVEETKVSCAGDRALTIGPGINMSGEIESCDHLVVEGTVEAALRDASVLEVRETGTYYGSVEIREAVIAGRFEGDLAVDGRITVKSTGVITGTISYKELQVEAGAVIEGRITPMEPSEQQSAEADAQRAKERAAAIAKAKEIKAKQDTMNAPAQPANTDEGLFQRQAASAE